ncbi:hypothetical protein CYMTET_20389 [Cymbomonas tetramitiformis]|uniref:Uncharacterized protein n=1 Tax=Cymbomonas tetramitiformis TaxID=36881 RepID=A0AAE0G5I7_9CHLO|nr:hypothetical protein CYMTET_20389 [Cymbomonas tetramitiformis]
MRGGEPPTASMQATKALRLSTRDYDERDAEDHEDTYKCRDIGVTTTLARGLEARIMVLDPAGLRSKAKRALTALRKAARAGARLTEMEAAAYRRDLKGNQVEGTAADMLMTGGGGRGPRAQQAGVPRHRTEGVFSDTRGREAWLSSIQVETHILHTTNLATVSLHQTKLADALNGTLFGQSSQYNTQMRNTIEKVRTGGYSCFVLTCDDSHWNVLLFGRNGDHGVTVGLPLRPHGWGGTSAF